MSKFKILNNVGYNKLSLFFDNKELEGRFRIVNIAQTKKQMRSGLVIGFFVLTLFSLLEMSTEFNNGTYSFNFLYSLCSYLAILPFMVVPFVSSYNNKLDKYAELMVVAILFFQALSTNFSHYLYDSSFFSPAHHGIIIILIYAFFVLRIRFFYTLILCLLLYVEYLVVVFLKDYSVDMSLMGVISITVVFVLCILAGYYNELLIRKEFLLIDKINKENSEKDIHNMTLENEVKRRTADLLVANQALKKAMQKAESSDILKSTILANISHEIRTPLTRILGFSELLTRTNLGEDKKRQYVGIIEESTNQLLGIITNVIELSKIQSDDYTIQNVTFYLHEMLDDLNPIFIEMSSKMVKRNNIEFVIEKQCEHSDMLIVADLEKLKKILQNLLHNAVKFTAHGNVHVSYTLHEEMVEFCVKDDGIGIDEENLEMIFDYFRQEDEGSTRKYGGAGVGLSICKGLVLSLGGKIWVNSKKGQGSEFYFTVPFKKV